MTLRTAALGAAASVLLSVAPMPFDSAASASSARRLCTTAKANATWCAVRPGVFKRPSTAVPAPSVQLPPDGSLVTAPGTGVLLQETFDGADGDFVTKSAFWSTADRGLTQNADWFAEDGDLRQTTSAGRTTSDAFRMWTRRADLSYVTAEMDIRFDGFTSGTAGWHGVNLWLNRTLCTPVPGCTAVGDVGGNSGYVLDFLNRDGKLTILKKVPGDTRIIWPEGQIGYAMGGTYYWMKHTTWTPVVGRTYRFAGRVQDNGNGTSTLQVLIDGTVRLQVVDDGTMAGPRLTGGRVGLRSDHADVTVDNLRIRR